MAASINSQKGIILIHCSALQIILPVKNFLKNISLEHYTVASLSKAKIGMPILGHLKSEGFIYVPEKHAACLLLLPSVVTYSQQF